MCLSTEWALGRGSEHGLGVTGVSGGYDDRLVTSGEGSALKIN